MDLIIREHPTSDDTPPWKGMAFRQPVYSDAMLECLKTRYPQGANLRERKHLAAIEFLEQELREMRAKEAALISSSYREGFVQDVTLTDSQHRENGSSPYASFSSFPLPAFTDEYRLDSNFGQEIVFSLADRPVTEGKKRKKMTQEEKDDYRKTRKLGACDNCKRHKAKCKHVSIVSNQAKSSQPGRGMSPSGRPSESGTMTPVRDVMQGYKPRYQAAKETPDLPQGHETLVQASAMTTVGTTPSSQQWGEYIGKEVQTDSSGYVPVSATSGPYSASPRSAFDPWSSFDPQLLDMDLPRPVALNEGCEGFPLSMSNESMPSATYPDDVSTNMEP